ncbi:MAG: cysteine synthase A [Actinomycetia bacterium]|nr:cysteine synthase A [Actinomycetes bacterium]
MPGITESVTGLVGNTPHVRLDRLAAGLDASVIAKLESHNPGGSVKDRIGLAMVLEAESQGRLVPGESLIVDGTSGNTGIALAMVGAARRYRVVLTMPESFSLERRRLLVAYGAELVLTPAEQGMAGAVTEAERIEQGTPGAFMPRQFDNPANPKAHYLATGPEIDAALGHEVLGAFVAGVGTGGTITGTGRYLREHRPSARIVAVEPAESPIIAQRIAGVPETPAPHGIQGIGANFVPSVLDTSLIDEVEHVSTADAIAMARRLAVEEGLLAGISSGANVCAALRVASRPEFAGTTIVTVVADTGERYLSTSLWEQ